MEKILSFLCNHLELCVACAVGFITLLFQVIKKRPVKVIDTIKEEIVPVLVGAINACEERFGAGNGKDKKIVAINAVKTYLSTEYPNVDFRQYERYVSMLLEIILSTPQKKGE